MKKGDVYICSAFLFLFSGVSLSCRIMCVYNGAQGERLKTKHSNKMNIYSKYQLEIKSSNILGCNRLLKRSHTKLKSV